MVLWDGDAKKGIGVFGNTNTENGSTITTVEDPTYGTVWKFSKPAGSNRCESSHLPNNLHAQEGDVWYIGWRFKVDMPKDTTTNAIFQWKSYPSTGPQSLQNWPVVVKTVEGVLQFMYHNPSYVSEYPWLGTVTVNTWTSIVIKLKVSRDPAVGYLEYWYNGAQQMLSNKMNRYPAKTLDGDFTDPKWGVYGAETVAVTNYVAAPKIATTFELASPP